MDGYREIQTPVTTACWYRRRDSTGEGKYSRNNGTTSSHPLTIDPDSFIISSHAFTAH